METTPSGPAAATPLLQVQGVTLAFGGVKALTGVGFTQAAALMTAATGAVRVIEAGELEARIQALEAAAAAKGGEA